MKPDRKGLIGASYGQFLIVEDNNCKRDAGEQMYCSDWEPYEAFKHRGHDST